MEYKYREAVKNDIIDYIRDNYPEEQLRELAGDRAGLEVMLNDDLWIEDSVTGNGSGSYTCNSAKAREYLLADPETEDIIREMISEFGMEPKTIAEHLFDWEYWDVSVRCYLLGECIDAALDEILGA